MHCNTDRILILPDEGADPPPPTGTGADFFDEQWGLNNTGQLLIDPTLGTQTLTGTPDADIDAPDGWDISTGDAGVKIAVRDSGVDYAAVEFAGKCVEQISFVTDYSATLNDIVAHGTHVAGIAAANTNNGIGTAGVGWQSSIGNLKACYAYQIDLFPPLMIYITVGVCPVSASAEAITHAADNGYHVINMSYGSDVMPFTFHYNDGDLAPLCAPDGMINGADLLIGQRIVLGLITAGILELSHGDLYPPGNPDGVINIQDMLLLQQIVTTP